MSGPEVPAFLRQINLAAVIDHAGRAGNAFFLAIFDEHPEVLACPWMHYTYSYLITEFEGADEIDASAAHAYWTRSSYFRFVYNDPDAAMATEIRKFGGDPDAPLDRHLVRRTFDDFFAGKKTVTCSDIVGATYLAYARGRGRDIGKIRYILVSDSISLRHEKAMEGFSGKVLDYMVRDFGSPRLIHLERDPRAGFASSRHQFVNSLGNMYGIRPGRYWRRFRRLLRLDFDWDSVFVFGFWLIYFSQTFQAVMRKKEELAPFFVTVRNEDLNLYFLPTLEVLCRRLGVALLPAWSASPYEPTMVGRPWTGTGAYNNSYQTCRFGPLENDPDDVARKVTGPNRYVTERWRKRLRSNEIYLLEALFRREIEEFNYSFVEYLPGRRSRGRFLAALSRPLIGELPTLRWIARGRHCGWRETASRLFYALSCPPFAVAGRLALLYCLRFRKVFQP